MVAVMPILPTVTLTEAEAEIVTWLENARTMAEPDLTTLDAYYNGTQRIRDLGIAIPPQLRGMHTVVGWPQITVDALDERLDVESFRYTNSTSADMALWELWQASNMDEEHQLAQLDALIYGRSYVCVGAADDGYGALITVESPLQMSAQWDERSRQITAALRIYGVRTDVRTCYGTLYLPDQTVSLESSAGGWIVLGRDQHNLGTVPVVRLANRQRAADRYGCSEITSQVRSITDGACRTLLGLEVAREFFASPKMYILGASESDFVAADGTPKTAWETYIGRVLALEADAEGNKPEIGQLTAYDPSAFTRVIDMYAEQLAACARLPAYMLGKQTQNPASADAIRSAENGLIRRAQRRQKVFSGAWESVIRLALRISDNGRLPTDAYKIETMWADAATPTPAATTDAITKQIAAGVVPPKSDVTREKLGYSMVERQRLAVADAQHEGDQLLAQLASGLTGNGAANPAGQ